MKIFRSLAFQLAFQAVMCVIVTGLSAGFSNEV